MPAKKSRFCSSVKTPSRVTRSLRCECFPKRAEVWHLRPGQHDAEPLSHRPCPFRRAKQIDGSFLRAVVREVPDRDFARRNSPRSPCGFAVPTRRAFARLDSQALSTTRLGRNAERDGGIAFGPRLNEHAIGLVQQPAEVRLGVLPACGVVRVGRVAQVQERREQERHAAPAGEPQPACDWERVRERGCVDRVERAGVPVRVAPHRGADRVTRRGEALPVTVRQQRQPLRT